jgi:hypothetical protein
MQRFAMIMAILLCGCAAASAQEDVFVRQLSTQSAPSVQQGASSSGAFVGQVSPGARPRVISAAPAPRHYAPAVYINQTAVASAEAGPLVVNEDAGIIAYGEAARPAIPTIGLGVTVVLTSPAIGAHLPDIGAGAVVL